MAVAQAIRNALPLVDGDKNTVRDLWDRLHGIPGGRWLFSQAVGRMAAYTSTIGATVLELRPGFARTSMRDRPRVRNHLRSVHAIALANLAELTGNVALAYSLRDDARFIVAGMNLDYLKKARGTIIGESRCEIPQTSARCELEVPVELFDAAGDVVVRATLRSLVGPKPPKR